MPQETIRIKFKPQGSQSVVQAIKALNKAQQDLNNGTVANTRSVKSGTAANKKYGKSVSGATIRTNAMAKSGGLLSKGLSLMRSRLLLVSFAMSLLVRPILRLVAASAQLEDLTRGFRNLLDSSENAAEGMIRLKEATDGTMSSVNLLKQANNAMLLGVTKNTKEMGKMFDIAQRLGKALGRDTTSSVESLITGIGRQSRLMLDNIGIIVKADEAYKMYAARIGTTADKLTDAEKKQAFFEAAMASAEAKVQDLGPEVESTTDNIAQMSASVSDAAASLGDLFSPIVTQLAKEVQFITSGMKNFIDSLDFGTTKDFTDELHRLGAGMSEIAVAEALKNIPQLHKDLKETTESFKTLGDEILKAEDIDSDFDLMNPQKANVKEQVENIIKTIQKTKDLNDLLEYQDTLATNYAKVQKEIIAGTIHQETAKVAEFDAEQDLLKLEELKENASGKELDRINELIKLNKESLTQAQNAVGHWEERLANLGFEERGLGKILELLQTQTGILVSQKIARDFISKTQGAQVSTTIAAVNVQGKKVQLIAEESALWTKVKNRIADVKREIVNVGLQKEESNILTQKAIQLDEINATFAGKVALNKAAQVKVEEDIKKAKEKNLAQEVKNLEAVLNSLKTEADEVEKLKKAYINLTDTMTLRTLEEGAVASVDALTEAEQKLEIARLESKGFDVLAKKQALLNAKNKDNAKLTEEIADLQKLMNDATQEEKVLIKDQIIMKQELIEVNNELFVQGKDDIDAKIEMFEIEEELHERRKEMLEEWKELAAEAAGFAKDLMLDEIDRTKDAEIDKLKSRKDSIKSSIKNERKRANALEDIDNQIEKIEKEAHNRAIDLKLKFVLAEFAIGLFSIWKGYIAAKAQIMATTPLPAWLPLFGLAFGNAIADTALLTASSGLQYAQINSQKMEQGGLIGGRLHSQGGTLIEAERGEFIMNRGAVDTYGTEVMNRINQGEGGMVTVNITGNVLSQDFIEDEAIPMIKDSIRRGNFLEA